MSTRRIVVRRPVHSDGAAVVVELSAVRGRRALDALIRAMTRTAPVEELVGAAVRLAEVLLPGHRITLHLPGVVSPLPPHGAEPHTALLAAAIARVLTSGERIVLRLPAGPWRSAWVLPVASPRSDERLAAVVVWSAAGGDPAPSALQAVSLALDLTALALDRHDEAAALRRADVVDELTGLANRRSFEHVLREMDDADDAAPCGVVSLDLDSFCLLNDERGADIGDHVLVIVADRLRRALRTNDLLARWEADQFMVLCRDVADLAEVEAVAARLQRIVAQPMVADEVALCVTASAGVAYAGDKLVTLPELAEADRTRRSERA